ncbi:MAG: hypothetical protein KGS47_13265 [Chloroflexi bacterium]|nr:hypothetical protein [Chloroflexota bacterium]
MHRAARVERTRQVLAAHGGWNARSRAALQAWARHEGLEADELVALLEQAVAPSAAAGPAQAASTQANLPQTPRSAALPWWLTLATVAGLATSLALLWLLIGRLPAAESGAPSAARRDAPAASAAATDPARTLPPSPVSFPTPPTLERGSDAPGDAGVPDLPLPTGEALSSDALERWRLAYAQCAHAWPSLDASARDRALRGLAGWIAQAASPGDGDRLRDAATQTELGVGPRERMLGRAFDAMLQATVRQSERLTPAAAARVPPGPSPLDADGALADWCTAQVPTLVASIAESDARERWIGWLQAAGAVRRTEARGACAIAAIDALLRSRSRLDGQGLAADALGSLLAAVPSQPSQPGFDATRRAFTAWLSDASIASSRLWALGGIWRSVGSAPDPWLLVGERDSTTARQDLVRRWNALERSAAPMPWQPLEQRLQSLEASGPASDVERVRAVADAVLLVRQTGALRAQQDFQSIRASESPASASAVREAAADESWADRLESQRAERRMEALQSLRALAPAVLADRDAQALATIAFAPRSRDERLLAQLVVQQNLSRSAGMLRALALEAARCEDPRVAADLVQRLTGRMLAGDDLPSLRASAAAWLLAQVLPRTGERSLRQAVDLLHAQVQAWADGDAVDAALDAGVAAWGLAHRLQERLRGVPLPEATQPLLEDLPARMRRLQRLAGDGPRGLAAATAVLCDLHAATLSSEHPKMAERMRALADAAAVKRSGAGSALEQSGISMRAIARMDLACAGAAADLVPAPHDRPPPDRAQAERRLAEADAALAQRPAETARAEAMLDEAVALDPSIAGSVDLARATAVDGSRRAPWLESATLHGAGAMLPADDAAADALALAALLRAPGQSDRVAGERSDDPSARALRAFAAAQRLSSADVLAALRSDDPARREDMRERLACAVMVLGDRQAAPWTAAIVARMQAPVPEAPVADGRQGR